jgi:hypothetical protein
MTDFRDLCARMADELDHYRQLLMDDRRETHALATEARAALAESEPEVYYEFVVSNDEGCTEAGGNAPTLSQAIDEGRHYLAQYSQNSHYTLEVRCVETVLIRRSN